MWDEQDETARWVHLICGIVFLMIALGLGYVSIASWDSDSGYRSYGRGGSGTLCLGAIYLSIRCLWYAVTGKNNINRDDFD